jgi:hypothetical protein
MRGVFGVPRQIALMTGVLAQSITSDPSAATLNLSTPPNRPMMSGAGDPATLLISSTAGECSQKFPWIESFGADLGTDLMLLFPA